MAPVEERAQAHETRNADVRAVALTIGAVLMLILVVHLLMYLLFVSRDVAISGAEAEKEPASFGGVMPRAVPRLQLSPAEETEAILQRERHLLETYGWVDRDAGVLRIPIERAMEIYVERERERGREREREREREPRDVEKGHENP